MCRVRNVPCADYLGLWVPRGVCVCGGGGGGGGTLI